MAQACTPTIITLDGCPHCANLESLLSNAGIKYTVDMSQSCQCYPCAILCNGSHVTSCGGGAENDVFSAIQSSVASTAKAATPTTPAKTSTAAGTAATTPSWKTTKWANELSVDWGAKNTPPVIAQTPATYQPPDVTLTPVLPLPPPVTDGITIALRNHKKMPIGRKVA